MATESYENFGGLYILRSCSKVGTLSCGSGTFPTDDEFKTTESSVGLPQQELERHGMARGGRACGRQHPSVRTTSGMLGPGRGGRRQWGTTADRAGIASAGWEINAPRRLDSYGAWWTSSMSGGKGWQRGDCPTTISASIGPSNSNKSALLSAASKTLNDEPYFYTSFRPLA